ncbi:MAG: response regulator [Magnetococcales bacterium]|nr:response regulator [Magnetococcales bacterium]MBF0155582.1 response regulator [Magnetococcales bacterium]
MTTAGFPSLLLVDDDDNLRMLFSTALEGAGFNVVGEANQGDIGLEKYLALKPDLTLLDIEMPVMDGIRTLKAILGRNDNAVVVMLTSIQQSAIWDDCLLAGAKAYIRKDAPLADLPARVMEVWQENRPVEIGGKG